MSRRHTHARARIPVEIAGTSDAKNSQSSDYTTRDRACVATGLAGGCHSLAVQASETLLALAARQSIAHAVA